MAITKDKGDLGEGVILADILKRGYKVAIPIGENWNYDLIVLRCGKLERVQCKYTESSNGVVKVACRSCNNWSVKKYLCSDIDWIACYDKTEDKIYYIPSNLLGNGRNTISLRLAPSKNNQNKKILFAKDFTCF